MGLTPLGTVHTIISLIAVGAAVVALARDRRLVVGNRVGRALRQCLVHHLDEDDVVGEPQQGDRASAAGCSHGSAHQALAIRPGARASGRWPLG